MSIDGIWTSEILGMFGWESTGIVVLNQGKAVGGGNNHYSTGTYKMNGEEIEVAMRVNFHGTPRTLFGSSDTNFSVKGLLKINDNSLEGLIRRADSPKDAITYRLTRQADLP